jgi:hypothetical protein
LRDTIFYGSRQARKDREGYFNHRLKGFTQRKERQGPLLFVVRSSLFLVEMIPRQEGTQLQGLEDGI